MRARQGRRGSPGDQPAPDVRELHRLLGIDARVITRAIERHYEDLLAESGASGYEYLEKIVQIPFRIPDPSDDDVMRFLLKQLGDPKPDGRPPSRTRRAAKRLRPRDGYR